MTNEKESKVTRAVYGGRSYPKPHGEIYVHEITFENNDSGEYYSTSKKQEYFIEGVITKYIIEEKENARGPYVKITPIYEKENGSAYKRKTPEEKAKEFRKRSRSTALEISAKFLAHPKIKATEQEKMSLIADKIFTWIEIDTPNDDDRITKHAQLRNAAITLDHNNCKITTIEDFLNYTNLLVQYAKL